MSHETEYVNTLDEPELIDDVASPWTPAIRMSDFGMRPLPDVSCYADKLLFAGSVTLFAGAPKAGKSTFLFHLINAVAKGEEFIESKTCQANVLYATEQSEASFRAQATKVPGFFENSKAFVVLAERNCEWRPKIDPMTKTAAVDHVTGDQLFEMAYLDTWEKQIEFWRRMIVKTHAKVLVIDTFTAFARLKENSNNDPGVVATRLMDLKSLFQTKPDLAIIVLHHVRKPDSNPKNYKAQDENDVLGSQAYIASVDQIVILSESTPNARSPMRRLMFKGRFAEESETNVALTKNGYIKAGI